MTEPEMIKQVRSFFELIKEDDIEAVLALTDSDPEYRNPADAMESGIRQGRSEFELALRNISDGFDFSELRIERWAVGEDEAVVEVRSIGTGKISGAPIDQAFTHHYTFRNGRVSSLEWFRDWDSATGSAGVNEQWEWSS